MDLGRRQVNTLTTYISVWTFVVKTEKNREIYTICKNIGHFAYNSYTRIDFFVRQKKCHKKHDNQHTSNCDDAITQQRWRNLPDNTTDFLTTQIIVSILYTPVSHINYQVLIGF